MLRKPLQWFASCIFRVRVLGAAAAVAVLGPIGSESHRPSRGTLPTHESGSQYLAVRCAFMSFILYYLGVNAKLPLIMIILCTCTCSFVAVKVPDKSCPMACNYRPRNSPQCWPRRKTCRGTRGRPQHTVTSSNSPTVVISEPAPPIAQPPQPARPGEASAGSSHSPSSPSQSTPSMSKPTSGRQTNGTAASTLSVLWWNVEHISSIWFDEAF